MTDTRRKKRAAPSARRRPVESRWRSSKPRLQVRTRVNSIQRWIIIPDLQVPYHDERSLAAVEAMMADYRWDGWLCSGDLMDFDCISSHNVGRLRLVEGKRLFADYQVAAKLLDRHQAIVRKKNPKAKFVVLEGNHEARLEKFIDANPSLEGLVEVPIALDFKGRRITWVPFWSKGEVYQIGRATFIHGIYTNQHHAAKHVSRYGTDVYYGHVHDIQCFSTERYGQDTSIIGQSLGNLCLPQAYMRGRPDRWSQAVTVFEFAEDGLYDYHVVRINRHRLIYHGKIYQG